MTQSATVKIPANLSLNGGELQNAKLQSLVSKDTATEADFWYDSVNHKPVYHNGTTVKDFGKEYSNGTGLNLSGTTFSVDTTTVALKTDIKDSKTVFKKNGTAIGTITSNQTSSVNIDYTVPTTATEVGALPSTTTINDLTNSAQQAALNSGVTTSIVTQVGTNATDISTINGKIPSQATTTNQLADKAFVNSSIATNTATFRGTFNSVAALEAYSGEKDDNDYAFVTGTDTDGNTYYDRYKYDGTDWVFEYRLNNSSFTSAQWLAINSGATTTNIGQIATNTNAISGLSTSKQDKLTAGSNIQINGTTISATDTVYTLPAATTNTMGGIIVGTNLSINNGVLSADAQSITVDTTLSTTSTNPVQNKVITTALAAKSSVTFVDWTV